MEESSDTSNTVVQEKTGPSFDVDEGRQEERNSLKGTEEHYGKPENPNMNNLDDTRTCDHDSTDLPGEIQNSHLPHAGKEGATEIQAKPPAKRRGSISAGDIMEKGAGLLETANEESFCTQSEHGEECKTQGDKNLKSNKNWECDRNSQTSDNKEEDSVFSTQVAEETLEAAKKRQNARATSSLFSPEDWDKTQLQLVSMTEVIEGRAGEHFVNGMDHITSKEYEQAVVCFSKAINLHPHLVRLYVMRAEAYLMLCDFQSSILNYKRACILEPNNTYHYYRLAFIYYMQGQCLFDQKLFPEALEAFSRAAEMRPEVIGYHTRSIACLAALERHGECLALVNKRLETEQHNADLFIMRARLHQLFRNTTLCYYDVKDALALEPDHSEALQLLHQLEHTADELKQQALNLNLMQRHRDALQKISLAIETNPSVADYHTLKGALHRRLGDFNAAIDDYLLAMDKTDHNEESPVYLEAQRQLLLTYNDFAVECFTKKFFEEAIILLNKAIKGEKREKGLYINRGDCFFKQGDLQFALADYHQSLELDPSDEAIRARIAIVHNEYGIQDYQDRNFPEAESRFTLAVQHNPHQGQYYVSRARTRQMLQNMEGARNDILLALHLDPSNPEMVSFLTRLFPGKTVKDISSSHASHKAREVLDNLVVMAGPVRLKPMEFIQDSNGKMRQSTVSKNLAQKPEEFSQFKICMKDKDFNIQIAMEKKRVSKKVKDILHNRKSLQYNSGRVQAFIPDPVNSSHRGVPKLGREKIAVNATGGKKSSGWRKFTMGVGLSDVK